MFRAARQLRPLARSVPSFTPNRVVLQSRKSSAQGVKNAVKASPPAFWTTGRVILFSTFTGALTYLYGVYDTSALHAFKSGTSKPVYATHTQMEKVTNQQLHLDLFKSLFPILSSPANLHYSHSNSSPLTQPPPRPSPNSAPSSAPTPLAPTTTTCALMATPNGPPSTSTSCPSPSPTRSPPRRSPRSPASATSTRSP